MTDVGVVAMNSGGPRYPGDITLELDLVIGAEEGPEDYILFTPTDLAIDGQGRMFTFDWDRKGIQVYDREGQYLRTLGRDGQGPGEFDRMGAADLFIHPDGTIDAIASAGASWKRWAPNGDLLFDYRAFNQRVSQGVNRYPTRAGITSFARTRRSSELDTMNAWWIFRLARDAEREGVVASYPLGRRSFAQDIGVGTVLPYIATLCISRGLSGRFAVTTGDSAWFDLYDDGFSHCSTVRWEELPEPLERQEFLDAYWEIPGNDPDRPNDPVWEFYQTVDPPSDKPVIYELLIDNDDRIWVRLWGQRGWPEGWGPAPDHVTYAVFNREGEYLYRFALPFLVRAVDSDFIYELFNDGEHTPQIRRYRWDPPKG